MSTNEKGVSTVTAGATDPARREQIPRFVIPETSDATRRLNNAASVSPVFIELTNVAVANQPVLVRTEGATASQVRDQVSYADAYSPLADELEALAHFVRHSVATARSAAGLEALTTYALAQRLSRQPQNAHLRPHVADMRRALGRGRKLTPEVAAQKAADRAAKAAAKLAKKVAKLSPPAPVPTTPQPK
jgi:hypothetical protein